MSNAAESFISSILNSYPFIIFLFAMPAVTIGLSIIRGRFWGLIPSFCLVLSLLGCAFIACFDKYLFPQVSEPPFRGGGSLYITVLLLFASLFASLIIYFLVRFLAATYRSGDSFRQYMKFKREQDKRE